MADNNIPAPMPYPYMFDPSQMSNKFSNYNDKQFDVGNYGGIPMNAGTGTPISSYTGPGNSMAGNYPGAIPAASTPGTTLNSSPSNQQVADLQEQINQQTINAANASYGSGPGYSGRGAETGIANYPGAVDAIIADSNYRTQANQQYAANPDFGLGMPNSSSGTGSGTGSGASSAAPAQGSLGSNPNYLLALSQPDKVVTPGFTGISPSYQPGNSDFETMLKSMQAGGGTVGGASTGGNPAMTGNSFLNSLASLKATGQGGGMPQSQGMGQMQAASGGVNMPTRS